MDKPLLDHTRRQSACHERLHLGGLDTPHTDTETGASVASQSCRCRPATQPACQHRPGSVDRTTCHRTTTICHHHHNHDRRLKSDRPSRRLPQLGARLTLIFQLLTTLLLLLVGSIHCDVISSSSSPIQRRTTNINDEGESSLAAVTSELLREPGARVPFFSTASDHDDEFVKYKYLGDESVAAAELLLLQESTPRLDNNNNNATSAPLASADFNQQQQARASDSAHNGAAEIRARSEPLVALDDGSSSRKDAKVAHITSSAASTGSAATTASGRNRSGAYYATSTRANNSRKTNRLGEFITLGEAGANDDHDDDDGFGFDVNNNEHHQPPPASNNNNNINSRRPLAPQANGAGGGNNDQTHTTRRDESDEFAAPPSTIGGYHRRRRRFPSSPPPPSSSSSLMMPSLLPELDHGGGQHQPSPMMTGVRAHNDRLRVNWNNLLEQADTMEPASESVGGGGGGGGHRTTTTRVAADYEQPPPPVVAAAASEPEKRRRSAPPPPPQQPLQQLVSNGLELRPAANKIISANWSRAAGSSTATTRKPVTTKLTQPQQPQHNSTQAAPLGQANKGAARGFSKLLSSSSSGGGSRSDGNSPAINATRQQAQVAAAKTTAASVTPTQGTHPPAPVYAAKARYTSSLVVGSHATTHPAAAQEAVAASQPRPVVASDHHSPNTRASGRRTPDDFGRSQAPEEEHEDHPHGPLPRGALGEQREASAPSSLKIFANQFKYTKPRKSSAGRKSATPRSSGTKSALRKKAHPGGAKRKQAQNYDDYNEELASDEEDEEEANEYEPAAQSQESSATTTTTSRRPSTTSSPARRAARTVANKTTSGVAAPPPTEVNDGQQNALYALYDLTDERGATSEYRTNYTSALRATTAGADNPTGAAAFADSARLSGTSRKFPKDSNATKTGTSGFEETQAGNQTASNSDKITTTKRRDTWERVRTMANSRAQQIVPPLIRLTTLAEAPRLRVGSSNNNNKLQPKQDLGPTTSLPFASRQRNANNSQVPAVPPLPLPLPLSNYINQQQQQQQQPLVAAKAPATDERMSIVRSGFLVPSQFGTALGNAPSVPMHSLRALAPAAMALLAHAGNSHSHTQDGGGPGKQLRALSQLRALLSLQPPGGAGGLQAGRPLVAAHRPQAENHHQLMDYNQQHFKLNTPANLTLGPAASSMANLQQLEQMLATSNQLGVSHLAASEPGASGEGLGNFSPSALANMQDFTQADLGPPAPLMRGSRGGDMQHDSQQNGRQPAPPPPPDSNESSEVGQNSGQGRGNSQSRDQEPRSAEQSPNNESPYAYYESGRGGGGNSSSGGGGGGGNNHDYYSSSNSRDHYSPSLSQSLPGGKMEAPAGGQSEGPSASGQGNSLRPSSTLLDAYEDYTGVSGGGPLLQHSTASEYEQDLADLDEEFNRHSLFGGGGRGSSRASRGNEYAPGPGPNSHQAANLMSDSMLSYSPERYETIRHYSLQPTATTSMGHHHDHQQHHSQHQGDFLRDGPPSGLGEYLSAAGSMSSVIPRPYYAAGPPHHHHHHYTGHYSGPNSHHHHHGHNSQSHRAAAHHNHHSHHQARAHAGDPAETGLWLGTDSPSSGSGSSYEPGYHLATPSGAYASWRPQRYHSQSAGSDYSSAVQSQAAAAAPLRSPTPYFALATAPSYLATAADTPHYNFPLSAASYAPAHVAAASAGPLAATPTETVSFTISPLAAAAAAAATALAAADKSRHQHHQHHQHHAWTFTLPRLASSLVAAQALAPQTTLGTPTMSASGSSNSAAAAAFPLHSQLYSSSGFRAPTMVGGGGGGGSYVFAPVPIYALGPPPAPPVRLTQAATGTPLSSAASGTAASILPAGAFHAFQGTTGPHGASGHPPALIAYRPASVFSSAPLLTSFAYSPFRTVPLHLGAASPSSVAAAAGAGAYHPLTALATSPLLAGHLHQQHSHHHHHSTKPSSGGGGGGRGSSSSSSALKPFIADLQWAESSKSKANNNNNQNGESTTTTTMTKSNNFVKTTAGGLTQMARNLTKKMFGSASQVRPQFVAPPANFVAMESPPPVTLLKAPALATLAASATQANSNGSSPGSGSAASPPSPAATAVV